MKGVLKLIVMILLSVIFMLAAIFIVDAENLTELLKYFTIYLVSAIHVMIIFTFSE